MYFPVSLSGPHTILNEREFWSELAFDIKGTGTKYDGVKLEGCLLHLTDPDLPEIEMNDDQVAEFVQWCRDVMDRAGLDHVIKSHRVDYPTLNYYVSKAILPLGEMSPAARKFGCIFNCWFVLFDYTYDETPDEKISEQLGNLIQYNKIWQDILLGKYGSDVALKNYPIEKTSPMFHPYLHIAKELYAAMLGVIVPEDADERVIREHPFFTMSVSWWSCFELKYSKELRVYEDIFRCYQLYSTGGTFTDATEYLVPNCVPPLYLKNDVAYIRLQNAFHTLICAISDLYGIVKDIRFEDEDNLILFRVKKKEISIQEAFKQSIELQNDQARQFIYLASYLRKKYEGDEVVERVLAMKELWMDGGFRYGYDSPRYKVAAKGMMKVTFKTISFKAHAV